MLYVHTNLIRRQVAYFATLWLNAIALSVHTLVHVNCYALFTHHLINLSFNPFWCNVFTGLVILRFNSPLLRFSVTTVTSYFHRVPLVCQSLP
jgi:hypothetical protein